MRLVKPSYEIFAAWGYDSKFPYSYSDPMKLIERAGRTCYKSEGKITDDSAQKFVDMIKKSGHLSVLEHSWSVREYKCILIKSPFIYGGVGNVYAGNLRAFDELTDKLKWNFEEIKSNYLTMHKFLQNGWLDFIAVTAKFICDRGVTHEFVRHRPISFSQESTRYCNYGKMGMVFVIPPCVNIESGEYKSIADIPDLAMQDFCSCTWFDSMLHAEVYYNALLRNNWSPQQARSVLPNSLKTEIVATANLQEWKHIYNLRTSVAAHPQIRELLIPFFEEMKILYPGVFE